MVDFKKLLDESRDRQHVSSMPDYDSLPAQDWMDEVEEEDVPAVVQPTIEIPEILDGNLGFLCGPAGTGKTFMARAMKAQRSGVLFCATTGIAAINLGDATTINSALGYYDTKSLKEAYMGGKLLSMLGRLFRSGTRRILVDELSMMDADQVTILVQALEEFAGKTYTRDLDLHDEMVETMADQGRDLDREWPIQLTFVGDFAQLPPVKAPYAFESGEWEKVAPFEHRLTQVHRQADLDFIRAIHAARKGEADPVIDYFGSRMDARLDDRFDGTTIMGSNAVVDRFNALRLSQLPGKFSHYPSTRWGRLQGSWSLVPIQLAMKTGALVMILTNAKEPDTLDEFGNLLRKGKMIYANGDLATVLHMDVDRKIIAVKLQRGPEVEVPYLERHNTIPIDAARVKALIDAKESDKIEYDRRGRATGEIVGGISYLPVRVAYATTVHKAQGLSLDNVQVNTTEGMFRQPGLLYVALSRARTANGLRLVGVKDQLANKVVVDARVKPWL